MDQENKLPLSWYFKRPIYLLLPPIIFTPWNMVKSARKKREEARNPKPEPKSLMCPDENNLVQFDSKTAFIVTGNHGVDVSHLEDPLKYFSLGIQQLGYTCKFSTQIVPGAVNILFEIFNDLDIKAMAENKTPGTRYVIVAAEVIYNNSFNQFFDSDLDSEEFKKLQYYRDIYHQRFLAFDEAAKLADQIWIYSQESYPEFYKRYGNKVHVIPPGYMDGFSDSAANATTGQFDFDCLFSGSLTPHRKEILQNLKDKGFKTAILDGRTAFVPRMNYIRRSRVSLHIKQYSQWKAPSTFRIIHSVMNKTLLLSEWTPILCEQQNFAVFEKPELIPDRLKDLIQSGDYLTLPEKLLRQMREELPGTPPIKSALQDLF